MHMEGRLKNAALLVALDISLKRINRSPVRCARNIMELGITAYPDKLCDPDKLYYHQRILEACKQKDANVVREIFSIAFL